MAHDDDIAPDADESMGAPVPDARPIAPQPLGGGAVRAGRVIGAEIIGVGHRGLSIVGVAMEVLWQLICRRASSFGKKFATTKKMPHVTFLCCLGALC